MQKILSFVVMLGLLLGSSQTLSAQNAGSRQPAVQKKASQSTGSLAQIVASNPQFSKLKAALEAADLTPVLESPGPFTVFAPTNEAFEKMVEADLDDLMKPESKDRLLAILRYHIVPGRVTAAQLQKVNILKTVETEELSVVRVNNRVNINGGDIRQPGVQASNGVIYVIDKVLIPADQMNIREIGNKRDN